MTARVVAALALGAALGVALAIIENYDDNEQKVGFTSAYCPADPASDTAAVPADIEDKSADYRGPGPHPAEILTNTIGPDTAGWDVEAKDLPATWRPPTRDGAEAVESVQVVVCGYQHSVDMASFLDGCTYGTGTGDHVYAYVKAGYTFRVFAARTGRPLGTFELDAVAPDCESAIRVPRTSTGAYHRGPGVPDPAQLTERLRPFIETSV